jgi:hypothetical protein
MKYSSDEVYERAGGKLMAESREKSKVVPLLHIVNISSSSMDILK